MVGTPENSFSRLLTPLPAAEFPFSYMSFRALTTLSYMNALGLLYRVLISLFFPSWLKLDVETRHRGQGQRP